MNSGLGFSWESDYWEPSICTTGEVPWCTSPVPCLASKQKKTFEAHLPLDAYKASATWKVAAETFWNMRGLVHQCCMMLWQWGIGPGKVEKISSFKLNCGWTVPDVPHTKRWKDVGIQQSGPKNLSRGGHNSILRSCNLQPQWTNRASNLDPRELSRNHWVSWWRSMPRCLFLLFVLFGGWSKIPGGGLKEFFIFTPNLEKWFKLTSIFQTGWNHHLELYS